MNPMNARANTAYSGRTTNWPMLWFTAAAALPLLSLGAMSSGPATDLVLPLTVVTAMLVVNALTATSLRASTGENGVLVRFGAFGWPRFSYPLERIAHAEAIVIPAWSILGWGISWWPGRGLHLTLWTGPALRLRLTNGRRITISMPDPQAAVATLEQARAAVRPRSG